MIEDNERRHLAEALALLSEIEDFATAWIQGRGLPEADAFSEEYLRRVAELTEELRQQLDGVAKR